MTTISPGTGSSASSSSSVSQSGLIANYELFLNILSTQLKNQDPLDPLDSAEYTSQLVEYSNVEQSIKQNQNLESIIATLQSSQSMSFVNYIGNEIAADASSTLFLGDKASWDYEISEDASGTFEVRDANGVLVRTGDVDLKSGKGTFTWDGQTDTGSKAVNGLYTISFDVRDANDNFERVSTEFKGVVDSIDWSTGEAVLKVGDRSVPVSAVISVSTPS